MNVKFEALKRTLVMVLLSLVGVAIFMFLVSYLSFEMIMTALLLSVCIWLGVILYSINLHVVKTEASMKEVAEKEKGDL